jgi:hypothetical protein
MPLPEFVTPVLSIAGPAALVFVVMRYFPHVARAVVVLLAGIAAIVTTSKERREASIRVLDVLSRESDSEPAKPPGDAEDRSVRPRGVRDSDRQER